MLDAGSWASWETFKFLVVARLLPDLEISIVVHANELWAGSERKHSTENSDPAEAARERRKYSDSRTSRIFFGAGDNLAASMYGNRALAARVDGRACPRKCAPASSIVIILSPGSKRSRSYSP